MKLSDFLLENGVGYDEFAYIVGCSAGYIRLICEGKRPSGKLISKIIAITEGKVKL